MGKKSRRQRGSHSASTSGETPNNTRSTPAFETVIEKELVRLKHKVMVSPFWSEPDLCRIARMIFVKPSARLDIHEAKQDLKAASLAPKDLLGKAAVVHVSMANCVNPEEWSDKAVSRDRTETPVKRCSLIPRNENPSYQSLEM